MFFQKKYDKELTPKEIKIIDKFIDTTLRNKKHLSTEERLDNTLVDEMRCD